MCPVLTLFRTKVFYCVFVLWVIERSSLRHQIYFVWLKWDWKADGHQYKLNKKYAKLKMLVSRKDYVICLLQNAKMRRSSGQSQSCSDSIELTMCNIYKSKLSTASLFSRLSAGWNIWLECYQPKTTGKNLNMFYNVLWSHGCFSNMSAFVFPFGFELLQN